VNDNTKNSNTVNVRRGVVILAISLALTVFLTSLVLETRDNAALYSVARRQGVDAIPSPGPFTIDDLAVGGVDSDHDTKGSSPAELVAEAHKLCQTGSPGAAADRYRDALALEPDNREALGALGMLCFSRGQYREAEAYIQRLVALKPVADHMWYGHLGVAQMRQGKCELALHNLQIVLQHEPDDGALHFALACIYAHLEATGKALDHLEMAHKQLGPELLGYISDHNLDSLRDHERFQQIVRAAVDQYPRRSTVSLADRPKPDDQ